MEHTSRETSKDTVGILQADDNRELNWDVRCRYRRKGKDLEAILGVVPVELAYGIDLGLRKRKGIKDDSCILT